MPARLILLHAIFVFPLSFREAPQPHLQECPGPRIHLRSPIVVNVDWQGAVVHSAQHVNGHIGVGEGYSASCSNEDAPASHLFLPCCPTAFAYAFLSGLLC